MKPKESLYRHRYAEAIQAYELEIRDQPGKNVYAGIGAAFLGLKRFDEAVRNFSRDNEIESSRVKGCFPSLAKVGTALWLMGKRRDAILQWHSAVAGILAGSISYGDSAGGGTQGLLLWYGAITLEDELEREFALEYLRTLENKEVAAISWPRPIISMILGDKSFVEVLRIGIGSPVLSECLEEGCRNLLARRRLCQALFYAACQERESGNEIECTKKMRLCSQLGNPIVESEWYLARAEGCA